MYSLNIQSHRTNDMWTCKSDPLWQRVQHFLSVSVLICKDMTKLASLSLGSSDSASQEQNPPRHNISGLQDPGSVPPSSRAPSRNHYLRRRCFTIRHRIRPLSIYAQGGAHPYDVVAFRIQLRCQAPDSLPPRESKIRLVHALTCDLLSCFSCSRKTLGACNSQTNLSPVGTLDPIDLRL